jgi:DNA-binding SARP family transcriptional activator
MLKAIIAFGGKDVGDEQLIDALWPEADGDVANLSFRTTLHRLRQLIGKEGAIELKEGRLTLDPRYCWVDAWAFQGLAEKAEDLWRERRDDHRMRTDNNGRTEFIRLSEKAISMYKGEFLPGDHRQSWSISMRERLKSKYIRLVGRLGNLYEEAGQWEKVIEFYEKTLEVDVLQEEFYRRLMLACHKVGRNAEALAMYDRCRKILSSVLGIEPSPETEAARKNIRA